MCGGGGGEGGEGGRGVRAKEKPKDEKDIQAGAIVLPGKCYLFYF